jgi:biopolymer transport protein ExbD
LRSRASGWLGLGLLLAGLGLIAGVHLWHATRTFVPLDIPVSLSRGHIQTGEFLINLEAFYEITIEFAASPGFGQGDCEQLSYAGKPLRTRWTAKRNGIPDTQAGRAHTDGCYLGGLSAESGRYELDVEVLSDSGSLNALKPRLHIEAYWGAYLETEEIADYLSLWGGAFALVGASLLCLSSFSTRKASPSVLLLQIVAPRGSPYPIRRRDLPLVPMSRILPIAGYTYAIFWSLLLVVHLMMLAFFTRNRFAIPARLIRPGVIAANADRHENGPLVYVDRNGLFYLNSKLVTPEALPAALEYELARRGDRSVYVEGDSDAAAGVVITAMDIVHGVGGKVVMMTPRMRAEAAAK